MNPNDLIPTAGQIPVHWVWFKILLLITFFIHILFMNTMVGTAIIAFLIRRKPISETVRHTISGNLTFIIPFTINFGVAPFLFLQVLYGPFIYVGSQMSAVYWLTLILGLMIAYYSAYYLKSNYTKMKDRNLNLTIGIIVSLFLLIAFLFTHTMTQMTSPASWGKYLKNPEGTILNLSDPTIIPRFLHFIVASVAVGGLFLAFWGMRAQASKKDPAQSIIECGMKWFTFSTLIEVVIGFWFLMSLPRPIKLLFMGGNPTYTALFIVSLLLTCLSVYAGITKRIKMAVSSTVILIFIMVMMRDCLRTAYLSPYFNVGQLEVTNQYSPFIMFFVFLAVSFMIMLYVIRLINNNTHPDI